MKNVIGAVSASIANILVSVITQRIFLQILSTEFLGLNGFFLNIVSMLGIFELGIGAAITFSLYKPLAVSDRKTIKALMNFYKKAYRIIALLVSVVGIGIAPFLPLLIKEITIDINIYLVFSLFLIDIICSYPLAYRRSILYADQKNYQINIVHICYLVIMNALQLIILALTKNYYLYLGIKIFMRIAENLAIHYLVHRQYPYLDSLGNAKLDKTTEKGILKKVRALFFHKVATFLVLGSDNIIISKFIGLVEVGLYSNYLLTIKAIEQLVGHAISALTPTIGHKLAIDKSEKSFGAFKKTRFAGFVLACVASTGFFVCVQPLISIWLGEEYLLDFLTVSMLSFNLFQRLQRYPFSTFKEAAGIYYEDRFVPLVESALNIVASIVLLHFFGLPGVFMGTIVSSFALWFYSYPRFVYKNLFHRNYYQYAKETVGFIGVFLVCASSSYLLTTFIHFDSIVLQFIANGTIAVFISLGVTTILLHNTSSFKYFITRLTSIPKKVSKK
ncbi:hypothetical protein IKG20_01540 [Candidatus Saccharibacteria bacterium]|nr:hypothetical protein [Candidatus Saccharibacteria bacterium]